MGESGFSVSMDEKTKALEVRRRKGMKMLSHGISQAEVARTLEVSRQTASRWARMLDEDSGSWRAGQRGRPTELTVKQLQRLERLIRRGSPLKHGHAQHRWSVALVTDLIEEKFGVRYSAANVRRILRERRLFPGYGRPAMKRWPGRGWKKGERSRPL